MISQNEFRIQTRKATVDNIPIDRETDAEFSSDGGANTKAFSSGRLSKTLSPRKNQIHYQREQYNILANASRLLRQSNLIGTVKSFKKITLCIRACLRLQRLVKENPWINCQIRLNKLLKTTLKYKETINERFKQWCEGICHKSLSTIPRDIHNYIQNPNSKVKEDKTRLILINSMKFLLENMAYCTHPEILQIEIKHFLFSQLFVSTKVHFTQFVSERTSYISQSKSELTLDQQSMIASEELLFFRFASIILEHQHGNQFVLIMMISVLQYLYIKKHEKMRVISQSPPNIVQLQLEYSTNQKATIIISPSTPASNKDLIITGLYDKEEIEKTLAIRPRFSEKIHKYFDKTLHHLKLSLIDL